MMNDDQLKEIALLHKDSAYKFRERRHDDWTENYTLDRDKVVINRLTQRQSVNVPLMKYSIRTVLKDIDNPPMLYFSCRDNDSQKEVFYNEYWKHCWKEGKGVIKDIVDKKQNMLFGRTFKSLNIYKGRFDFGIEDPQDMLVERYVDPTNLDTARYLCHEHIFRPLSSLAINPMYDKSAIKRLKEFYASDNGMVKAEQNEESLQEKNDRMRDLGLIDVDNPILGETYVELNAHFLKIYDEELKRDVIWHIVLADGQELLSKKPLHELIGKTKDDYWMDHFPYTTWGEDPEVTDFWNDGIADPIRSLNKVVNSWVSQLVENRTLRNFGMQFYDSSVEGYTPQTFEAVAWGMYPFPGNPNEGIKRVDIPELSESLDEINFILTMAEKVSGATATQQGLTSKDVLLGDIKLALQNAQERTKGLSPLYTDSWEEFGTKYTKMLEAGGGMIDAVRIFKKGNNTKHIYSRIVKPSDWQSELGYEVEVKDLAEDMGQTTDKLQKLNAAKIKMPMNQPLDEIYNQKLLEFAELDANEVKLVMDAQKALPPMPMGIPAGQPGQPTQQPGMPVMQ